MFGFLQPFDEYLLLERGLSKNTIAAYSNDLGQFCVFLQKCGIENPEDVTRDNILDFLEEGREAGNEISTTARRLVSIKMLFAFLYREKHLKKNITEVMDGPRLMRLIPDLLSLGEVEAMISVFNKSKDPLSLRNRAILETLYASGIRVSECVGLRIDDVDFRNRVFRVLGKGSKERMVPFGRSALASLRKYLTVGRPELDKSQQSVYLFLSKSGRKLNREWLWNLIKQAALKAGISKNIYPHMLRHSFASHLLANGADLRVIQEMLGHADIGTTQIYTHTDQNSMIRAHRQFHPRG